MRAEQAMVMAEEERRKKVEKAHKYAAKYFQSTLREILRRIKKASLHFNEIEMGIEVESLATTGQWREREFRKKLLAEKVIVALRGMGYTVVSSTAPGGGFLSNPTEALLGYDAIITPTTIERWTIMVMGGNTTSAHFLFL